VKLLLLSVPVLVLAVTACAAENTGTECLDDDSKSCMQADLAGADLSGRDLRGWDFSGADLTDADLTGANLEGAKLDHADLDRARLEGTRLVDATLFNTSSRDASWRAVVATNADLEGTDLRGSTLDDADLSGARLQDVNLAGASLRNADLSGALLARVYLRGVSLTDADLSTAVFADTSLNGAETTGASWAGAVMRAGDNPPDAALPGGAIVCEDLACEGTPANGPFRDVEVTPEAFRAIAFGAARFVSTFGEGPTVASRGFALAFLGAYGVYPESLDANVPGWDPAPLDGVDAVRDVAAAVATYNVAVALRRNPKGVALDGKMRGVMLSRDVVLWELTRDEPGARGLAAVVAASSAKRAIDRAKSDGFADRKTVHEREGAWVPTPPGWAPGLEPGWGTLARYLPGSEACAAASPPADPLAAAMETAKITENLTDDQKAAARFWDDERLRTPTPPGHWVILAAQVLSAEMSVGRIDAATAFAVMYDMTTAMGDTFIQVWADKYRYQTARPITVLAGTVSGWNSYLGNPPFPAYPSGHAAVSRAAAEVLTRHLGQLPFTDQGANESSGGWLILGITPRSFDNFLDAAEEAGLSRIWGGIHVMDDYIDGAATGACVARLTAP